MSTCKDCLHYEVCDRFTAPNETYPEVGGCRCFKPKADVVEVVRCKDCKRKYTDPIGQIWCRLRKKYEPERLVVENHFCSYGERKESEVRE